MLVRWNSRPAHISRWFDEALWPTITSQSLAPAADVREDGKAFTIAIELPGVKVDDVAIEVAGNTLSVTGQKKSLPESEADRALRVERRFGSFERTFRLPEQVDKDGIVAAAADGVLTITLPKTEKAQPKTIAIKAA